MDIQRINWKLFIDNADAAAPEKAFKAFSGWIEDSDEVFVDASDYAHVIDGPKTVLIGHYCDYWLDHTDRKLGFLYNQRQDIDGDNGDRLKSTLQALVKRAKDFNDDNEFKGGLQYNTGELQFTINDRLAAPNTKETFATVEAELRKVFPADDFKFVHNDNGRQRFSVTIQGDVSLDKLAKLAS